MTLKVYDFYTKDKLSTNRYHNILMNTCTFYILVSKDGGFKELDVTIPKKYNYESTYRNYVDFKQNKVIEYNVLYDYIKVNESSLSEKWNLTKDEFIELKEGLKLTLVREFSTCSVPRRVILETTVLFKMFINKILRRIVECYLQQ